MTESTLNKAKKKDIHLLDPRGISFDPENNPRQFYGTDQAWKEFKNSIKVNGVQMPISIKRTSDGIVLVHGYRRMKAVMELIEEGIDIKYVKAEAVAKGYNEEKELLDHLTLNSGLPLTPMEEAIVFQRLIDRGWTQKEIGDAVGKTQGKVSNTLKLANLPKRIQNYINEGLVSGTLVSQLLKANKNNYQEVTLQLIGKIEQNDGSKKKVTEKSVAVKRPSKYHKLFTDAVAELKNRKASKDTLSKAVTLMQCLDGSPEELANVLETM